MKRQLKTGKNFLREFIKGFHFCLGYILQKADRIEGFLKILVYFVSLLALTIFNTMIWSLARLWREEIMCSALYSPT